MRFLPYGIPFLIGAASVICTAQFSMAFQENEGDGKELILLPVEKTPDPIVSSNHLDIENYDDGTEKIRREISLLSDDTVVNHGSYEEFYKSGKKFAEGRYKNGVQDGEWSYWFENGNQCKKVVFREGVPHGEWTIYREDGTNLAARSYVDGAQQGTWLTYFEDGKKVRKEEQYDEGVRHGKWIERFPSGKTHIEENYRKGKRHGKYIELNEEGIVLREMEFKDGQLDGQTTVRTADGREIVQQYRDGQLVVEKPQADDQ